MSKERRVYLAALSLGNCVDTCARLHQPQMRVCKAGYVVACAYLSNLELAGWRIYQRIVWLLSGCMICWTCGWGIFAQSDQLMGQ